MNFAIMRCVALQNIVKPWSEKQSSECSCATPNMVTIKQRASGLRMLGSHPADPSCLQSLEVWTANGAMFEHFLSMSSNPGMSWGPLLKHDDSTLSSDFFKRCLMRTNRRNKLHKLPSGCFQIRFTSEAEAQLRPRTKAMAMAGCDVGQILAGANLWCNKCDVTMNFIQQRAIPNFTGGGLDNTFLPWGRRCWAYQNLHPNHC